MRASKISRVASATVVVLLAAGASVLGLAGAAPANAQDTGPQGGFLAPQTPSFLSFQSFTVKFDQPIADLTIDDFEVGGDAGCQPTSLEIAPNFRSGNLNVSNCGVGIVYVMLKAESVQGETATGPTAEIYSPKVQIIQAPQIGMPAVTSITSRDSGDPADGPLFKVNFDMPIGGWKTADAVSVWGDANCVLGSTELTPDLKTLLVTMNSCSGGLVGIRVAPFTITKDDGSCCGPLVEAVSEPVKVAAFGLPEKLDPNKGGPADPMPLVDHVTGKVWLDLNANHVQDDNEPGLAGVTVALDNETVLKTGANGEYDFGALKPGMYSINVSMPGDSGMKVIADSEGKIDGVARVMLQANRPAMTWFAVAGGSAIKSKFSDNQGNAITEPVTLAWAGLDGIPGNEDDVFITAEANADGTFQLDNLPAGNYRVVKGGKDALSGSFILAPRTYELADGVLQRDIKVTYKDLAYTGGTPWNDGLLAFGVAAFGAGLLLLRRSKSS